MVLVKLLVEGGKMTPGPAVAQQLGPMGINLSNVISDVNEKTKSFKGINVPIVLDVNPTTKEYTITVLSPPTSELLKKEAGTEKGSGDRIKFKSGNIAFEQVISVAEQKHDNMLSNDFFSTVKSVIGSCQSMGLLIDNKEVKEIMLDFEKGEYDALIKAKKTEVSPEKAQSLKDYFTQIDKAQELAKAQAEATTEKKKSK
jgi:large subunit ribosomal protein L11